MRAKTVCVCAALIGAVIVPVASASPTHETEWKRCGSQKGEGAGWYQVRANHVSCPDARAVARKYWNKGGPDHVRVDGVTYHCRDEQIGEELSRVRCKDDGERRVKFKVGA